MRARKKPIISIIVPCRNEEDNIIPLAKRVRNILSEKRVSYEIIFINDGSIDNTSKVIKSLEKTDSHIIYHENEENKGITFSWKSGLRKASGKYVCLIDADMQYQPEDIYRLYREIIWSKEDLIQGWRSHIGRARDIRFFLSIGLNLLLNSLFEMHLHDNKSGFILCRHEVLDHILQTRYKYHYFQTFVTVAARTKGYSIKEIETIFSERIAGQSFIPSFPLKIVFFTILDLFTAILEYKKYDFYDQLLSTFAQLSPPKPKQLLSNKTNWLYKIYQHSFWLHHWKINKNSLRYYEDLTNTQWLSVDQLYKLQLIKLKKIVNQAYYHVPYYREKFDKLKIKPENIKSLSDLSKLPYLTKNDIRKNLFFNIFADNVNKKNIQRISTSGSTGEPSVIYVDKEQLNLRFATTLRGLNWAGFKFGNKQLRLWHQTIGMSKIQIIKERLDAFLSRRMFISAYEMNQNNLNRILEKIKNYQPVIMDGYAESFNLLAKYMENKKIVFPPIKGVISSAQTLPDKSREVIEKQFNTRVFDKYGSREFSGIAYQCEQRKGHHVNAESYIVEIIKNNRPAKPGEIGEVVITDLTNKCMPLIRYRLGDLAESIGNRVSCPCGRGLPLFGEVKGRVQSIIIGTQKQYLPGTFFAHLFKDYWYAIKQFQIIQDKSGEIKMKIIKGEQFSTKILNMIQHEIKKYLGSDLIIKVEYINNIPLGKTGKHQLSISKLNLDFQKLDGKIA